MFASICRRRLRVSSKVSTLVSPQFVAPENVVFIKPFSSKKSSSDVNGDDPNQSFTISYLINLCGLSSKDALSISNKLTIKSPENPDSVLELLRRYGFTNANISLLITGWPTVLLSRPEKTLLPKLEFFRSIGVPRDVLAKRLSYHPRILRRSLENYHIPFYNFLKILLKSDSRVVNVFKRASMVCSRRGQRKISANMAIMREQGIPGSCIVSLMAHQPKFLVIRTEKLASLIDRAAETGLDRSKVAFINTIQVFAAMSESTLRHKMVVYRRCGWSEYNISLAFLKYPLFMKFSEKKIIEKMNFLVNELGLQPVAVTRLPVLLSLNLDRRMKPRLVVAKVLKEKGLLKNNRRSS